MLFSYVLGLLKWGGDWGLDGGGDIGDCGANGLLDLEQTYDEMNNDSIDESNAPESCRLYHKRLLLHK